MIAAGRVQLNNLPVTNHLLEVSPFCGVVVDGAPLQTARSKLYIMMHKSAGHLSATRDQVHPTVLDLIDHPEKHTFHLAGRLDRASTGLLLLTNDSQWSEQISHPDAKIPKVYLVETVDPIPESAILEFARGFHFAHEGITTRPANLEILEARRARVTIFEGKYHQIKRMFHRINQIRLTSLHREKIGPYILPTDLEPGLWRFFDPMEFGGVLE